MGCYYSQTESGSGSRLRSGICWVEHGLVLAEKKDKTGRVVRQGEGGDRKGQDLVKSPRAPIPD